MYYLREGLKVHFYPFFDGRHSFLSTPSTDSLLALPGLFFKYADYHQCHHNRGIPHFDNTVKNIES